MWKTRGKPTNSENSCGVLFRSNRSTIGTPFPPAFKPKMACHHVMMCRGMCLRHPQRLNNSEFANPDRKDQTCLDILTFSRRRIMGSQNERTRKSGRKSPPLEFSRVQWSLDKLPSFILYRGNPIGCMHGIFTYRFGLLLESCKGFCREP